MQSGNDVLADSPRVLYPIGAGELARIEIGTKFVTLIGVALGHLDRFDPLAVPGNRRHWS